MGVSCQGSPALLPFLQPSIVSDFAVMPLTLDTADEVAGSSVCACLSFPAERYVVAVDDEQRVFGVTQEVRFHVSRVTLH